MKIKSFVFILYFIIFASITPVLAQELPPKSPNLTDANGIKQGDWVIWYDSQWNQTNIKDSAQFYRKISFVDGKPSGQVNDFYLSGVMQWKGQLISTDPDVKTGLCEWYYKNGGIQQIILYENDKEHGKVEFYYDNGNKQGEGYYEQGERSGIWVWYKINGEVDSKRDYSSKGIEFKIQKAKKLYNNGQYCEAATEYEAALSDLEKQYGKNDTAWYAYYVTITALSFEKCQQFAKAEQYYLKAKSIYDNVSGTTDPFYGIILTILASLYESMGQYNKALPLYLEALENCEKFFGKEHSDYGDRLNNLALLYKEMGQYDKALPLYLEALENCEKTLGKEHSEYGVHVNNLAELYTRMGKYDKALPLYLEALENCEKSLGKEHSSYGVHLFNLAELYKVMGQYDKALPLYLEALENCEKTFGKEHSEYGTHLHGLASLYRDMGQYDKALQLDLEALENCEKALGKDHPEYGFCLNNLAQLYFMMGLYDKAIPLSIQALENCEKTLGKEHPEYGTHLNTLALLYKEIGQYDKALPLYIKALENCEKIFGKEHHEYGVLLYNIAVLYRQMGLYDKALPLCIESLENTKKSLGKEHPDFGDNLNYLALLYEEMGLYDKALPLYLEALENTERSLGKEHPFYGVLLNNLAGLIRNMGQYDKALSLFLEALENCEKAHGKEHPEYRSRLNNLASLYKCMGQYDKALPLYIEAKNNIFLNINRNFSFMSETAKEKYLKTVFSNFELYQSFFMQYAPIKPEVASEAYTIELANKGMILQTSIQMRQSIVNSNNPDAIAKYDEWIGYKTLLSAEYAKPIKDRRSDLKELENKAEVLEGELSLMSSGFGAALNIGKTNFTDVQKQLKPNEVAIEFASFDYHNGKEWTDSTMCIALVLRPDDEYPQLVPLFEQRKLDTLLVRSQVTEDIHLNNLYNNPALYNLIWQPLEKYIQAGSTVYFAPSGSLHQLSLSAMSNEDGMRASDLYNLVLLSTTAKLTEPAASNYPNNDIVLFGGINYNTDAQTREATAQNLIANDYIAMNRSLPDDIERGGKTWGYLLGAEQEVVNINSLAKKNKTKTWLFSGTEAIEEQFKLLSRQSPRYIHIATHGFFFPDPEKEYRDDMFRMDDSKQSAYRYSDNPLNRAGLLFAGANLAWAGGVTPENIDDGILTAYEVANTFIPNTELVVLSACETGLGDIKGSEGVFGLQRAFKNAGAEYIIMSLWKVPDEATMEMMTEFYTHLFSGKPIPESFKLSQEYMKQKYPDEPYKWGAFVLVR